MTREIRLYQPGHYEPGENFALSESASRHAALVLRLQVGDNITLFADNNEEFYTKIQQIHKKTVHVTVLSKAYVSRESFRSIHLIQALIKGDRMEWIIQKAVELGVASIRPLITSRTILKFMNERWEKKSQQWQAIAQGACEQCGRNQTIQIHAPISLEAYLQQVFAGIRFVLHPYENRSWQDYSLPAQQNIQLMVGPEGGFSEEEIARIIQADILPVKLGPRILRAETAAIAALSVMQAVWGDLN